MFKHTKNILKKAVLGMALPALLLAVPTSASAQDITSGLVGHWKLDEVSGSTLADSSGNGNDLTWEDGVNNDVAEETLGTPVGNGLTFDGTNTRGYSAAVSSAVEGTSITLSAWVRSSTDNGGTADWVVAYGDNYGLVIDRDAPGNDQDVFFYYRDNDDWPSTSTGSVNILDGRWHHIAGQYDPDDDELRVYLDGVELGSQPNVAGMEFTQGNYFTIGGLGAGRTLNGNIADVRVYNRVLTAEDISTLATKTKPGAIRYNETSEAIEYHSGSGWVHAGLGSYSPNAVDFDGSTYLLSGSTLSVPDSKKVTGSVWYKADTDGNYEHILYGQNGSCGNCFRILKNNNDSFRINGPNVNIRSSVSSVTAAGGWNHLLFSFDLSDPTKRHLYVNGVSDLDSVGTYTDSEIPASAIFWGVSNVVTTTGTSGTINDIGEVADLWVEFGTYVDLSVAANRAKFISANSMPMYLGEDGSLPFGFQPDIFLSGDTDDWHTNKGTAGSFTETGTLTDASNQPGGTSSEMGWVKVGSSLTVTGGQPDITSLTTDTIAYADSSNDELRTYTWNGSTWSQVGNSLSIGVNIGTPQLTIIDTNTIVLVDATTQTLRTYSWDGTDWSAVGNTLAIAGASGDVGVGTIDTNLISFFDEGNDDLRTYSWDGTDWSQVGNDLNLPAVFGPRMALIDTNRIAFYATTGTVPIRGLRTYEWDGTDWTLIGNLNQVNFSKGAVETLATNKVAVFSEDGDELRTYVFDGTDWSQTGTALNIPQGFSGYTGMSILGRNTVAFMDHPNDNLETYTLSDLTPCASPTAQPGSIIYNTDEKVMQYCNGTDHVAMGPIGGTGGGGCANPAGSAGDMIFNNDLNLIQFCNSEDWVGVGYAEGQIPTAGLVHYWSLDETSGSTVTDSVGSLTTTWTDGVNNDLAEETITGVKGNALSFDGTAELAAANFSIPSVGTLSMWVRFDDSTSQMRFFGSHNDFELIRNTSNRIDGDIYGASSEGGTIAADTWYHIVYTYDEPGDASELFINNVSVDTGLASGASPTIPDTLGIGHRNGNSQNLTGDMDEVRIYSRVLSTSEITVLYNDGTLQTCSGGGVSIGGSCWYYGSLGDSCTTTCTNAGLTYDAATESYAGSAGELIQCEAVLDALSAPADGTTYDEGFCGANIGCYYSPPSDDNTRARCTNIAATAGGSWAGGNRACACN